MPEIKQQELINIEWQAPEFEKYEKGPGWFISVGAIALIIFTISLMTKNFIFAFLIILAVFIIFIYALKEPRIIKFKIDGQGLNIDEKFYRWEELKSFWIFYEPPQLNYLSIESKRWTMPLIKISLKEQDPVAIRQALIKFIPEEKQEESLIDILTRYLRF